MSSILFFSLAAHEFATTDDDSKCGSGGGRHGQQEPCELVADKGYHSREGLKGLDGGVWKTPYNQKIGGAEEPAVHRASCRGA
jgi:hypothetical protein